MLQLGLWLRGLVRGFWLDGSGKVLWFGEEGMEVRVHGFDLLEVALSM